MVVFLVYTVFKGMWDTTNPFGTYYTMCITSCYFAIHFWFEQYFLLVLRSIRHTIILPLNLLALFSLLLSFHFYIPLVLIIQFKVTFLIDTKADLPLENKIILPFFMVRSDFHRFASADVCRCWSFAFLFMLRAQIFATRKVVVKD